MGHKATVDNWSNVVSHKITVSKIECKYYSTNPCPHCILTVSIFGLRKPSPKSESVIINRYLAQSK